MASTVEPAPIAWLPHEDDDPDVVVLPWPGPATPPSSGAGDRGRLFIVAAAAEPPQAWDIFDDWLREPVDWVEFDIRRTALRHRVVRDRPARIDGDGLLRRGPRWVALSDLEVILLEPLLAAAGVLVHRDHLNERLWPGVAADETRRLDVLVGRVRRRIESLGVRIQTVRQVGHILDYVEPPAPAPTPTRPPSTPRLVRKPSDADHAPLIRSKRSVHTSDTDV